MTKTNISSDEVNKIQDDTCERLLDYLEHNVDDLCIWTPGIHCRLYGIVFNENEGHVLDGVGIKEDSYKLIIHFIIGNDHYEFESYDSNSFKRGEEIVLKTNANIQKAHAIERRNRTFRSCEIVNNYLDQLDS